MSELFIMLKMLYRLLTASDTSYCSVGALNKKNPVPISSSMTTDRKPEKDLFFSTPYIIKAQVKTNT